ncbi:hypothetical protein F7725_020586 [Dissostichus mawsoni]|uniref:RNA 2-O ribose methyltransferase substrate binding domain-containing protein n=1 Tax=Dissostichus mawsoni TaxID=36200 RepID=A0A7J5YH14_DISMA|nr:hypothetical protein F7725_020586 [Dissostichus mawsoni]
MAAYMRSMICLVSIERNVFLHSRGSGVIVETKRYVRGLRRNPVRVLFPENEADKVVKPRPQPAGRDVHREKGQQVKAAIKHPEEEFVKARSNVQETTKHAHVTVSITRSRTFREHQGKILLEGRRLICDALNAGANPHMVFFSTADRLRELPLDKLKRATLVKVKFEDIKIWSDVVAPQGVIAIFARPEPLRLNFGNKGDSVPLSLICDNIRDPGNLGTMLRCAAAAGCHDVLLTKVCYIFPPPGCVDAWEPKVLRAAMGAHFRLPITRA